MIRYEKLLTLLKDRGISHRSVYLSLNIPYSCWNGYIHKNKGMRTDTISKLCALLNVQPGDILTYVPDEEEFPKEITDKIMLFQEKNKNKVR